MSFVPENVVEMYDGNQIGVPENVTQNLAPIEVTGTATRAYAVGDYMVFGGLLRKVTQAIAQGGTITVGTNVESTKVSTELQGISSDLSELVGNFYTIPAPSGTSEANRIDAIALYIDANELYGINQFTLVGLFSGICLATKNSGSSDTEIILYIPGTAKHYYVRVRNHAVNFRMYGTMTTLN